MHDPYSSHEFLDFNVISIYRKDDINLIFCIQHEVMGSWISNIRSIMMISYFVSNISYGFLDFEYDLGCIVLLHHIMYVLLNVL